MSQSHCTTRDTTRAVEPYRPPGRDPRPVRQATYFLECDHGLDARSAAPIAEPSASPPPPPRCRLTLVIDGRSYGVRVEFPGGASHVVRLDGPYGDRCQITLDFDASLIGTCFGWTEDAGCRHANAAYDAGLFPELALATPKPTIAVGGGEP